ncbi:MAG: hypothetical protein HQ488_01705 [Parcubacteria group bacterium]|nr:hypothetical protein [Parcubacteria group bacterium]
MRRSCLVTLLALILLLVVLSFRSGEQTSQVVSPRDETTTERGRAVALDRQRQQIIVALQALSSYKERFALACKAFADSSVTQEDLSALLLVAGNSSDPAGVIALCGLDQDQTEDLLQNALAYRIEDGDRDAAKLAFTIAGSECAETPGQIDKECRELAKDREWDVSTWRSCSRNAFRSYKQCAIDVLTDYGMNPVAVESLYLGQVMSQTGTLVHAAKDGSADPKEVIAELMSRAQDRVLVETIEPQDLGPMSFTLFALSNNLTFQGRPDLKQDMQPMLDFWAHRCNLEYSPPSFFLEVDDVLLTFTP